jgi:radical SAM family uncharacterized protein
LQSYDSLLGSVLKPARYTGGEWNSVLKNPAAVSVRFVLAMPDVYEMGMSNLGLKILYEILNQREDVYAERAYCPWPDMEEALRDASAPLTSLETRTPLGEFDAVGFSLQYELTYTSILTMLDLSGISLYAHDRKENDPFIIGGGPCAYNPEPVADFFDFFIIGEGEEVIVEVASELSKWKGTGRPGGRRGFLSRVSHLSGIYVPSFYTPNYSSDGQFLGLSAVGPDVPAAIRKRVVEDLDAASFPAAPVVPYLETVHDRIMLELFRGCTRGCRFCQAGVVYRPVRERRRETLLKQAQVLADSTGYNEISLVSLSSADYSCLKDLVGDLLTTFSPQRVSLSLPSLRVDSFSIELANQVQQVRKSGLTFAPEAGTQRLRDVINKGVTEENLVQAATAAFQSGWSSIKLYFMIGLPTETDEDIAGIADMARQVAVLSRQGKGRGGAKISVSVSTFVPKPHTPFQWFGQISIEEMERRQRMLRSLLKERGISLHWHDARTSRLEGVIARGDRRLSAAIEKAWRLGARFDGWSEHFRFDLWERAFEEAGINTDYFACRERVVGEPLPWSHLQAGADEAWLAAEWEKATQGQLTEDCRQGTCTGCGVCQNLDVSVIDWRADAHV